MRILICDNELNEVKNVEKLVSSYSMTNSIDIDITCFDSSVYAYAENQAYDIAFIDIEMPEVNGLELSEKLQKINPDILIVIFTSFPNYLDDAMKIHVFRYLSKPIDKKRFNSCLADALIEYHLKCKTIVIDSDKNVYAIKTKDILYIENMKYGCVIHTKDDVIQTSKKPLEIFKLINQPECFVYSHNSIIVNLQNVIKFDKTSVFLRKNPDETVWTYISQRKYSSFKKAFYNFMGGTLWIL